MGEANGGISSSDGNTFTPVAYGTWIDDNTLKTTTFTPVNGRYMRIQALTEAGGRGPWTSAAEINVYSTAQAAPPSPVGKGSWGPTIDFPLVPVSMANDYETGNLLAWSSYNPSTFGGSSGTQTITATYFPGSQTVAQALITNTQHDMFCEGLALDFGGRAIATGGNTASATSIYDSYGNGWVKAAVSQVLSSGPWIQELTIPGYANCPRLPGYGDGFHWQPLHYRCVLGWRTRRQEWRNLQHKQQHLVSPFRCSCCPYAHCRCAR